MSNTIIMNVKNIHDRLESINNNLDNVISKLIKKNSIYDYKREDEWINKQREEERKKIELQRIIEKITEETTIESVLSRYTIKEIIEAIGIDKIQDYLRKEKLKKIKDKTS